MSTLHKTDHNDLASRSLKAVWHPCTQMKQHESWPLISIERGDGVWLYDDRNNRYLDAISSWWVNLFGHNEPRIKEAIRHQLDKLEHTLLAGFTHRPVVELSERLSALTGLGHAFYASDGASATEIALKMSTHYWRNKGQPGKNGVVYLENSYHGETIGALSMTDVPLFREAYTPLIRNNIRAMSPDWRQAQSGESPEKVAQRAALQLESIFVAQGGEIAAFILEPLVQGAAGMAMYHESYLRRVRALCDRFHIHLIADEIAVGFGRTGTMFACEHAQIKPDLLCLSKGITGGYLPLAVVQCQDEIFHGFYHDETRRAFLHSHSYSGNPLACSAALAVLDIFEQDQVIAENRKKSERFTQCFKSLKQHPYVTHFRQFGMIWAFDVLGTSPDFAKKMYISGLERGILLRPIGNTVYFMPPYILSDAEAMFLAERTWSALNSSR